MEKYLASIFKELPFPCYLTYRLNENADCMVYDIIESPNNSCDDEEELTSYILMIRLYSSSNKIIQYKHMVKNLLKEKGFKKITIPVSIYNAQIGCYQQAMEYKILIDTESFNNL